VLPLILLWLVGINLRTVLLGVPPTLPALHAGLSLTYSAAGLLTSLPVLVMAVGSIPGAFLTARLGARQAVGWGLCAVASGAALRGVLPSAATLFAFTLVLALGIAIAQPAVPSLAQAWLPRHVARVTAVYSNGLLVGEVLAATLTLPLLLGLWHLGWQGALAAWAAPALATLGLWVVLAPSAGQRPGRLAAAWLPQWRSGRGWHLGLLLGGASIAYYGMNTWVPDTLTARHAAHAIPLTLGLLNFAQLPVSAGLVLAGDRLMGRRWPYIASGVAILGGVTAYALAPTWTAPFWAGLVGAAASLVFILNLALPALESKDDVARLSGFMLGVGYGCAFLGPSLGGVAWDRTGQPLSALLPMALAGAVVAVLGATLPLAGFRARLRMEASPPVL
jgi:MFS transporter, CP family, cyanate transporter